MCLVVVGGNSEVLCLQPCLQRILNHRACLFASQNLLYVRHNNSDDDVILVNYDVMVNSSPPAGMTRPMTRHLNLAITGLNLVVALETCYTRVKIQFRMHLYKRALVLRNGPIGVAFPGNTLVCNAVIETLNL